MIPEPLLEAIFQPGEESLRVALKAARRRRLQRVLLPVLVATSCVVAAIQLSRLTPPQGEIAVSALPAVVQPIQTRPLAAREIIKTSQTSVRMVSTARGGAAPAHVEDWELLGSFAGGRAALVGVGKDRCVIEF
jgi:hypothetical protein